MTNWRRYSTGTGGGGCDIVTCGGGGHFHLGMHVVVVIL